MSADLLMMIGGLVPTGLASRLALLMMRSWRGGFIRLVVAHLFSIAVVALVAGMGMADGGAFAAARALGIYIVPQALWFLLDTILLVYRRRSA